MLDARLKSQQGIGIIELMVSITIGLFILAGVVQLYLTSTQNVSTFEGSSRIQENARYTFSRLEQDVAGAGNLGCFSLSSVRTLQNRVFNLLAPQGGIYDFTSFIGGENDDEPGVSGDDSTDSLYLRVAGVGASYPALEVDRANATIKLESDVVDEIQAGQIMAISDCSSTSIFVANVVDTASDTVEITIDAAANADDPYNTSTDLGSNYLGADSVDATYQGQPIPSVYFGSGVGNIAYKIETSAAGVAAGATCGSATPEYCALRRDGVEIVEGVEDFQIEYGWIEAAGLKFADADVIDALVDAATVWRVVDRVRVTVTFNSINTATTNEGMDLLRRSYSRVFVMHNQLPVSL